MILLLVTGTRRFSSERKIHLSDILVLGSITSTSGELVATSTWFGKLSADINDHLRNEIISESNPLAEGFILSITGKRKAPLFNTTTTTLQVILSTPCQAVTTITVLPTPSPNHRSAHEPALILSQPTIDEEDETRSFLIVDDDKLNDELLNSRMLMDGSGESRFRLTVGICALSCVFLYLLATSDTTGQ